MVSPLPNDTCMHDCVSRCAECTTQKNHVRQNSAARDAVHNSPDAFEHSPCLYELHHSVNVLSLQQPLYVQGLVLCHDVRVQHAAAQT